MKSIEELLLNDALYLKDTFTVEEHELLFNLKHYRGTIDYHCSECNSSSTFQGTNKELVIGGNGIPTFKDLSNRYPSKYKVVQQQLLNQYYFVETECTRDRSHKSKFFFKITDDTIEKVGQYPSLATLNQPMIEKYRPVLSKEKYKEFNRAVGLTTHGVGIGSFVYLRRIFEDLIEEAHKIAQQEEGWNNEDYIRGRMDEKIGLLKHHLPTFLSENKMIYGILSKGVHELSENECLDYFPIMKVGIELMLDEKLEELEKKKKQDEVKKALSSIQNKIKKNGA